VFYQFENTTQLRFRGRIEGKLTYRRMRQHRCAEKTLQHGIVEVLGEPDTLRLAFFVPDMHFPLGRV
jgi:hypothetical protein